MLAATLIIAVSAMVYNQHQMKLFQFNPKYRPVIVTALGGEGTSIFGFELIGNGEDKTLQLEDYITAIKYQDGDEVVDNLILDLEEDLGYNVATALAITAGGYALATFTSGTSIPFAWFSDALLGVKSVYNVNRFCGKVSKLVDNVDPSTLNKAKSKRKQSRKKDTRLSQSQIYLLAGVSPTSEMVGGLNVRLSSYIDYNIINCQRMKKGSGPIMSLKEAETIIVLAPGLYQKSSYISELSRTYNIHHNSQNTTSSRITLPGFMHTGKGFNKSLHGRTGIGSKARQQHNPETTAIWKGVAERYCHN